MPDPLHAALVHFPVALAVLIPFLALLAALVIASGRGGRASWTGLLILQLLLAGTAWVAVETGEREEERVEEIVGHDVLHTHEEAGERLLLLSALVVPFAAVGLARGRAGRIGRALFVVIAFAMLIPAYRVGRTGGELVYEHGAAEAYTRRHTVEPAAEPGPEAR